MKTLIALLTGMTLGLVTASVMYTFKSDGSFCVNGGPGNGYLKVSPMDAAVVTRLSDGVQERVPVGVEELAKTTKLPIISCPKR